MSGVQLRPYQDGHVVGQRVLLANGRSARVEDLEVGDELLAPHAGASRVARAQRARGELLVVRPTKGRAWLVGPDQPLTLVKTAARRGDRAYPSQRGGGLVGPRAEEWLTWSRTARHVHKLVRAATTFPDRDEPALDPYLLGILLGDGGLSRSDRIRVTTPDPEVVDAVNSAAAVLGLDVRQEGIDFHLTGRRGPGGNVLLEQLRELELLPIACEHRFVPDSYRLGSESVRIHTLAGLIDSDGSARSGGYEYSSKSSQLAADVAFLGRSLGLAAYVSGRELVTNYGAGTYWRVSISGDCSMIPCRVARKRLAPRRQVKDVLRTGLTIERTGIVDDHIALEVDGPYLLDDFTVVGVDGRRTGAATLPPDRRCSSSGGDGGTSAAGTALVPGKVQEAPDG